MPTTTTAAVMWAPNRWWDLDRHRLDQVIDGYQDANDGRNSRGVILHDH